MAKKTVSKTGGAKPRTKARSVTRTRSAAAPGTSSNSKRGPGTKPRPRITNEDIRRRAYEIYLEREPHEGTPESDWFRAEEELFSDPGV